MRHRSPIAIATLFAVSCVLGAQDPPGERTDAFRKELDRVLAGHPFFAKVDFTVDTTHPPFLFLVQRPAKDDPEYVRLVVGAYLPFLAELARIYDAQYAAPLALVRSPTMPTYAIAVLASEGNYHDFARAIASRSLHMARAHYDPVLRLAVTYQVAFGGGGHGEERQALLHEFGHVLQHAYSSTGQMTKPTWFNEGLADYRASATNVASSLREPPLQERHVRALAFGYGNRAGRQLMAPLEELVQAESYEQIVEATSRRAGHAVTADLALAMFYSQAEMVVRFLHEGEDGKYRPGFQRYLAAVQGGASGVDAFRTAFAVGTPAALLEMDQLWRKWLTAVLRKRNGRFPDLTGGSATTVDAPAEMPPPIEFDPALLAWRPEESDERFAAVRRLCSTGDYEAALLLLPGDKDVSPEHLEPLRRERPRIHALTTVRDELLAELARSKSTLAVRVADADCKGKVVRVEADGVVMLVDRQERKIALSAMTPDVLLREGNRLKKFTGAQRWIEVWLRWLDGQKRASMKSLLELGYPAIRELVQDLPVDLDDNYGRHAQGLIALQRLQLTDDPSAARKTLEQLQALVRRHGKQDLLQQRKEAIVQLARAIAERAFAFDDAAAMGIHGALEKATDGSVRVRYTDPLTVADADFTFVADAKEAVRLDVNLAYDGPTVVRPALKAWDLIGSGSLRWAMPLSGRQEIELEFCLRAAGGFLLLMCREELSALQVAPDGSVMILDQESQIADEVGSGGQLIADRWHKLKIVHDGQKRLETWLDGQRIADVSNVGSRVRGELRLFVHSSNPIGLRNLSIRGRVDPLDPLPVRERFVQNVLDRLWP